MGHFVHFFLGTSWIVTLWPTAIKSLLVSYTFHEPTCAEVLPFLGGCMHVALGLQLLARFLLDVISCPVSHEGSHPRCSCHHRPWADQGGLASWRRGTC
nr:sodium-independent sulfate anion transporter-like isoform X2 [Equus caballus]